jgi:phage terminase small subunit
MSENVPTLSETHPELSSLTLQQQMFVREFLVDLNATQAAIRAGYSKKSAGRQSVRLSQNDIIQAVIAKEMAKRAERVELTMDRVVQELAKMAFANIADYMTVQPDGSAYVDLSKASTEQLAALAEITVDEYTEGRGEDSRSVKKIKIKMNDKRGNLELLGKHLGGFREVKEHVGKGGGPIQIARAEALSDDELAQIAAK